MSLPHQKLGPFEILDRLGAGAMGDVYRARDTTLGRDVAIKVLPEVFVRDEEQLARFEREARVLASLNHPNIASIHELRQDGDTRFLVLELVAGHTLEEKLKQGPLALEESVILFTQIASALENAHEQGIVHRDLKPANVMITDDGRIKLLDFGLAKAINDPVFRFSNEETVNYSANAAGMTGEGKVLGTPAYMAPEQASGKPIDKRADIWAFGCCLYESLSSERPFLGDTATQLLACILEREPAWEKLPAATPARIRLLVWRCLQKDPQRRLRDIGEARFELSEKGSDTSFDVVTLGSTLHTAQATGRVIMGLVAGLVVGIVAALIFGRIASETDEVLRPAVSETTNQPRDTPFHLTELIGANELITAWTRSPIAISPDGKHIAVVTNEGGRTTLYLRKSRTTTWHKISEASQPDMPVFSPDSQSLYFSGNRKRLQAYSLADGTVQTVLPDIDALGLTFVDDLLICTKDYRTGLHLFDTVGAKPVQLTTLSSETLGHFWPHMLPDGKHLLYTDFIPELEKTSVRLCAVDGSMDRVLIPNAFTATYVPSGHVLFVRDGNLMAVIFDKEQNQLSGSPTPILKNVYVNAPTGYGGYSVSDNGILVYARESEVEPVYAFSWIDRDGNEEIVALENKHYGAFNLSADDTQLALTIDEANNRDVWVYDFQTGIRNRLSDKTNVQMAPQWLGNKDSILYVNDAPPFALYRYDFNQKQHRSVWMNRYDSIRPSVSADGQLIAFCQIIPNHLEDVFVLDLRHGNTPTPIATKGYNETKAAISPNGKYIAYQSDANGNHQIYVVEIAEPKNTQQITVNGGEDPIWARDGSELFFRKTASLLSVTFDPETGQITGQPSVVFAKKFARFEEHLAYQPSRDGKRFLILKKADESVANRIHYVFNLDELLKQKVK